MRMLRRACLCARAHTRAHTWLECYNAGAHPGMYHAGSKRRRASTDCADEPTPKRTQHGLCVPRLAALAGALADAGADLSGHQLAEFEHAARAASEGALDYLHALAASVRACADWGAPCVCAADASLGVLANCPAHVLDAITAALEHGPDTRNAVLAYGAPELPHAGIMGRLFQTPTVDVGQAARLEALHIATRYNAVILTHVISSDCACVELYGVSDSAYV